MKVANCPARVELATVEAKEMHDLGRELDPGPSGFDQSVVMGPARAGVAELMGLGNSANYELEIATTTACERAVTIHQWGMSGHSGGAFSDV
eukprot:1129692-Prymnesium_polylepis.1